MKPLSCPIVIAMHVKGIFYSCDKHTTDLSIFRWSNWRTECRANNIIKHTGEMVVLTCNNPDDDGNPDCDIYTWNIEGNDGIPLPTSKTLEFQWRNSGQETTPAPAQMYLVLRVFLLKPK